ncbi:MAG: tRNA (adenosine(37)-N6)-threonylcarbamoyltransferase complex dimerization subunit type 1 TsaB [SAR324 cluster bacterium]|nr:tRNA (adenosine(37)-N6)-threonylcarbamoyltransferase complex dimerization subunit type 1 TsaB [SAR324 cluster bacterium]
MNILALNTAFTDLGICLVKNDELVANYYSICKKRSEQLIFKVLDDLLTNAKMHLSELDFYVVVKGPGSYTGLRIGMGVAKTFAQIYQKPVIGATSLELLASMGKPTEQPFYAILNCTRTEIFHAQFQFQEYELKQLTEIHLTTLETFLERLENHPVILKRTVNLPNPSSNSLFEQLRRMPLQYPVADAYPLLQAGKKIYRQCNGNFSIVNPIYIKKEV